MTTVLTVPTGLLIGGQWRDAADGRTFEVENSATGEILRRAFDLVMARQATSFSSTSTWPCHGAGPPEFARSGLLYGSYTVTEENGMSVQRGAKADRAWA